jgi:hypothetical protein
LMPIAPNWATKRCKIGPPAWRMRSMRPI